MSNVLNLEDELVNHCCVPDSAMVLHAERFPEHFIQQEDEVCRTIFSWTMDYVKQYREAPTRTIVEAEWHFEADEPQAPVEYVIEKFRERYRRNEAQAVIKTLARTVNHDPDKAADIGFKEFNRIRQKTTTKKSHLDHTDFGAVLERYNAVDDLDSITFGIKSMKGVANVDDMLGGLRKGCLYYIIGRPKRFKSWILLNAALEAYRSGRKVAFFSLEMPKEEMMDRALCLASNTSWAGFKKRKLMPKQEQAMQQASDRFADAPGFHMLHPARGERTVQALLEQALELEAEAIYIDQLKFVEGTRPISLDLRHREVEYINEEMKDASEHLPWFVAAQFNREAANIKEMGDLANIGLSDSIGQTADMLLGLHQTKDMRNSKIVEFGTIESRSFEHARWHLYVELNTGCHFQAIDKVD